MACHADVIHDLASTEAKRIRKFRDAEEEETDSLDRGLPKVPLLHVSSSANDYTVRSSGASGHPNEGRMEFVRGWIQRALLRARDTEGDATGTYRIELHDATSYLARSEEFRDVLSFSRSSHCTAATIAMIPDPYQAAGHAFPIDHVPWSRKRPIVMFAGSSTGDTEPDKNVRIQACTWSLNHPVETDFRISAVVQMRPYDIVRMNPVVRNILLPPVPVIDHYGYKFLANMVGNTACWSRVPMIMHSSSLMFHVPHADMTWYYPMMRAGEEFVECVTHDDFLHCRQSCMRDDRGCSRMVKQANAFFESFMTDEAATIYARHLLFDIRGM